MPMPGSEVVCPVRSSTHDAQAGRSQWSGSAVLVATGCCVLAIGLLVYMTDRDPGQAVLFPMLAALSVGPIFGALGPWLPSFVHPFAFSLFTAAALPRTPVPAYGVCGAWWAVNMAFEAVQHAQVRAGFAEVLQRVFGDGWLTRALSNYALRGSFDVGDVVAATAGALAAAEVLSFVHRRETRHAQAQR
jgi:hypothetical protein